METFNDLKLGTLFCFAGSVWEKKSTRTAWYLCKSGIPGQVLQNSGAWYYFGKAERVNNS